MTDALAQVRTRNTVTPQNEQADPRQRPNNAGGFGFVIDGEARIRRFLTIGVEGGTFYVSQRKLVTDNAAVVLDWARNHATALVALATEISVAGRAPRNEPALFAVAAALALGDSEGREAAARAVPQVARTGTHLFAFCGYLEQFRGWGRKAQRAVSSWYLSKDADELAYQLVKYRQRDGWTHADVLRLAHPCPNDEQGRFLAVHDRLFRWVTGSTRFPETDAQLPSWITAYERAREIERGEGRHCPGVPHRGHASSDWTCPAEDGSRQTRMAQYVSLIRDYPGLPWEALPDEANANAGVLGAMTDAGMPQGALIRQLPKLTRLGVLPPMSARLRAVCDQIRDPERLRRARVHPLAVLIALRTYARGASLKGDTTWVPEQMVIDALDEAFYGAFGAVEPSGKRTMLCTDISGSMGWPIYANSRPGCRGYGPLLYPFTAAEIAGAMAMVTARFEPQWGIYGFSTDLRPLSVSPRMRLDEVLRVMFGAYGGGTDCAAPMVWAREHRVEVDTFAVYTDNETWFGPVHPHEALRQYRDAMGIDAKMQVIAVAATEFSIADPADPRQLDVSGFDSAVPQLLADHSRGDI